MRNLGTGELFIVVVVLFVLFGGKKLPELAKSLGEAGKEFNKAFKGDPKPVKKRSSESAEGNPPKETPEPKPKEKPEEIKN